MCEWHECSGCESPLRPGEFEVARIWLSGLLLNDGQGANLRAMAYQGIDRSGLTQRSAVEVVDELAWKISSGQIKVCQRQSEVHEQAVVGALAPRAAPAPAPTVSRTRSAPAAPPPPEPTTMPRNVDAAAMAAVLTEAANDGVPFCEVCEKARAERERKTAGAVA